MIVGGKMNGPLMLGESCGWSLVGLCQFAFLRPVFARETDALILYAGASVCGVAG